MTETTLNKMADSFVEQVGPYLGDTARVNDTFYAYNVVSRAIFRLRQAAFEDKAFTAEGFQFLGEASAFLARLALRNWQRRGLNVEVKVRWGEPHANSNHIELIASRFRDGKKEINRQDFWKDLKGFLRPPQYFPYCGPFLYSFESIVLPSPEALYLYGSVLLQSPHATGNWLREGTPGGLPEDFEQSKQLLIDDLHTDCGLPVDHPGMRQLSYWTVFPPYGWQQNDYSEYNLMTLFSQIDEKKIVTREEAFQYLKGLLRSQSLDMRNMAARCLMVFSQPPASKEEARAYSQALHWRDYPFIKSYLLKTQAQIEGDPAKVQQPEWCESVQKRNQQWVDEKLQDETDVDPFLRDPRYTALENLATSAVSEAVKALQELTNSYPESWTAKMLHSTVKLNGSDPVNAEQEVRELIAGKCPNPQAHLRLGTHLKYNGRRDEALELFKSAVDGWPWNYQAVDSCLWLITDPMVGIG